MILNPGPRQGQICFEKTQMWSTLQDLQHVLPKLISSPRLEDSGLRFRPHRSEEVDPGYGTATTTP